MWCNHISMDFTNNDAECNSLHYSSISFSPEMYCWWRGDICSVVHRVANHGTLGCVPLTLYLWCGRRNETVKLLTSYVHDGHLQNLSVEVIKFVVIIILDNIGRWIRGRTCFPSIHDAWCKIWAKLFAVTQQIGWRSTAPIYLGVDVGVLRGQTSFSHSWSSLWRGRGQYRPRPLCPRGAFQLSPTLYKKWQIPTRS